MSKDIKLNERREKSRPFLMSVHKYRNYGGNVIMEKVVFESYDEYLDHVRKHRKQSADQVKSKLMDEIWVELACIRDLTDELNESTKNRLIRRINRIEKILSKEVE